MKAWHVHSGDPYECSILVFTTTRGKAKHLGCKAGLYDYGDFIDVKAIRVPEWDNYIIEEKVIHQNEDLPEGAPKFYVDDD